MSRLRIAAGAVVVAILLAACSGSDGTSETTTPATQPTPTEPSIVSTDATTTSAPPTSTTSTTPPETTTTTTTTAPPPTTTEPAADSPEVAVPAALIAAREAYLYAVYNLDAPDALARLQATHATGSPSYDLALENVQTLVDNGWLARPNPDVPDTVTIESDVVLVNDTTADVVACVVGAGVVYAPGANVDGSDLIINDEIEAALNRVTMVLQDGQWKLREGVNLALTSGTVCSIE